MNKQSNAEMKSVIKDTTERITEEVLSYIEEFGDGEITATQLSRYIKSIVEHGLTEVANEQIMSIKNSIQYINY